MSGFIIKIKTQFHEVPTIYSTYHIYKFTGFFTQQDRNTTATNTDAIVVEIGKATVPYPAEMLQNSTSTPIIVVTDMFGKFFAFYKPPDRNVIKGVGGIYISAI